MNTITRGGRGRKVAFTATILAVVGLGLAGCQTGVADPNPTNTQDAPQSAQQVVRSAEAAQSRYEGLAEYWQLRAQRADTLRAETQQSASRAAVPAGPAFGLRCTATTKSRSVGFKSQVCAA